MARSKEYIIPIAPIPWKRPGKNKDRLYDQQVHDKLCYRLYLAQQHGTEPPFTKAVKIEGRFYLPIPASIPKRKKYPDGYPDRDNLEKFLLDAITSAQVIWRDDCIVCDAHIPKVYGKEPRTHIIITELE